MAKPAPAKFYVVIHEENYIGKFKDLKSAQDCIDKGEMVEAYILEISKVWMSYYPEEPEMEFHESDGKDL